jgi:hypothetical protein
MSCGTCVHSRSVRARRLALAGLVLFAASCSDFESETSDEAETYCNESLGTCFSEDAAAECIACYRSCGAPCRFNASCPPNGFVCE